jgi:hypothetical protein
VVDTVAASAGTEAYRVIISRNLPMPVILAPLPRLGPTGTACYIPLSEQD